MNNLQEMIDRLKRSTIAVDFALHNSSVADLHEKVCEFAAAVEALHYNATWYYEI